MKEKSYTYTKAYIVKTAHEELNDVSFLPVTLWRSCGEHEVKKQNLNPKGTHYWGSTCRSAQGPFSAWQLGSAGEQVRDNRLK